MPLCHGAKHTPGPGVGELRAGDAARLRGHEGLAAATLQPESQQGQRQQAGTATVPFTTPTFPPSEEHRCFAPSVSGLN